MNGRDWMIAGRVVLILKRLRRRGHGFKSHPTDQEKPGIEPRAPLVYKA